MSNYTRFHNSDGADQSLGNKLGMVGRITKNVMAIKILSYFFIFLGILSILIQVSPSKNML